MNKIVYLDSSSSTKPKFFTKDCLKNWMNPNSVHQGGIEANKDLIDAENRIMKCLGLNSGKVLFCRCASEAVEWLCRQFHHYGENLYTYCSPYEHDSVTNSCCYNEGNIDEELYYFNEDKIYLHQYMNHITGRIFDIESIGKKIQSTDGFFGSDITAALGHCKIPENLETFCDAVWFSGRKIHCETIGAIWVSDRLYNYITKYDERNLFSGTPNVAGAIALSYAVDYVTFKLNNNEVIWEFLASYLNSQLVENNIESYLIGTDKAKSYAINAIRLPGFNADGLVQYLSSKNIYISAGHSACSNDNIDSSRVLESFGLTKGEANETIRISFSDESGATDIDALVDGIVEYKRLFV